MTSSQPISASMDSPKPSMRRLVDFYDPVTKGSDASGRTLDEILSWTDDQLEWCHDYIQTLFPLAEESMATFSAPILDAQTTRLFRQSRELRSGVLRALKRMLSFYGFDAADNNTNNNNNGNNNHSSNSSSSSSNDDERDTTRLTITPKESAGAREVGFAHWLKTRDHNHQRITRIIRSLRILGLAGAAKDFYTALLLQQQQRAEQQRCGSKRVVVGSVSLEYWANAHDWDLEFTPDGRWEIEWLRDFN